MLTNPNNVSIITHLSKGTFFFETKLKMTLSTNDKTRVDEKK
jgi:hypothetical protein